MSEPDVSQLLSVQQAIEIIDAVDVSPRVEKIALSNADGLVLAQSIRADRDYPPFDKSQMDGFAVRCADVSSVPAWLTVVGEIAAGSIAACGLAAGQAMAIMTGAPLPDGADGIVPVEETSREGEVVQIRRGTLPGKFIARRGSEVRAGDVVLESGALLGPMQLAVAATVGCATLQTFARPVVAVLTTGDELVPVDQSPAGSQIRNSNNLLLVSLLKRLGCEVRDLGIVRDQRDAIRHAIEQGLRADALFVTGGMSMGEYDFVPRTLLELGVDLRITKLRIKPGKPFVFGRTQSNRFVFGLPGNPVSAFVCTVRLASRLVARMAGRAVSDNWSEGILEASLPANGPREFYQPVNLIDGKVQRLEWKGSADVFTLAHANALLVRGENDAAMAAGTRVRVLMIP